MGTDAEYNEQDSAQTTYNRPEITSLGGLRIAIWKIIFKALTVNNHINRQ